MTNKLDEAMSNDDFIAGAAEINRRASLSPNEKRNAFMNLLIQYGDSGATIYVPHESQFGFYDKIYMGLENIFNEKDDLAEPREKERSIHMYHSAFNISDRNTPEVIVKPCVSLIAASGSAKMMVNAARVSYNGFNSNKATDGVFTESDAKLLKRLFNDNHGTPSEHNMMTWRLMIPNPIFKQFLRHRAGTSFNEMSGRYSAIRDKMYTPARLFKQSTENHQGSAAELIDNHDKMRTLMRESMISSYSIYKTLLEAGVSKELARMQMPSGFYTEAFMTMNMRSFIHFMNLRIDPHAQFEARQYAIMMALSIMPIFPEFFKIMLDDDTRILLPDVKEMLIKCSAYLDEEYRSSIHSVTADRIISDTMKGKEAINRSNLFANLPNVISTIRQR